MESNVVKEQVKYWLAQGLGGTIELLHATSIHHTFTKHFHEGFAIGVIENGVEAFSYRRTTRIAPAGSIVILNPGEVHTGQAGIEKGWRYRMLYPEATLLQRAPSEIAERQTDIPFFSQPVTQSEYGLMVQILSGLITYLLLAIYCRKHHDEKVSIKRVKELRIKIQDETRIANSGIVGSNFENSGNSSCYVNT